MIDCRSLLADNLVRVWREGASRYLFHAAAGNFTYNAVTRRLRPWPGTWEQWLLVNDKAPPLGVMNVAEICGADIKFCD